MPLTPETALRKDLCQPRAAAFQHRHYAEIARIIRESFGERQISTEWSHADIMRRFADELAHSNPRFDRARFLRACQP